MLPRVESGYLGALLEQTGVMVPKLLHYDAADHVLVLSDLGPLPDLSKIFGALGGYTSRADDGGEASSPLPNAPRLGERLANTDVTFFETLGTMLGSFFAQLHSQRVRQAILNNAFGVDSVTAVEGGKNGFPSLPEMKTVVHEHAIKPLRSQLCLFPNLVGIEEADALFSAIDADFSRDTAEQEQCFVIGDCWTGTVLLNLDPDIKGLHVGIIDWEFANLSGRGINGDLSQFLAHLELFLIAAYSWGEYGAPGHVAALRAILKGLVSSYSAERDKVQNSALEETITRSALLSHGAELINCAFWKIWICKEYDCLACNNKNEEASPERVRGEPERRLGNAPHATEEASSTVQQCKLVTKMVSRGLAFLRCAVAKDLVKTSHSLIRREIADGMQPSLIDFFT